MIGFIVNALIALGVTYWLFGDVLTVELAIFFVVLVTSFEVGRLHRKVDKLK